MNLFKRKDVSSTETPAMPPELNNYYQAEKRQQTAVTWLLGFATLAITIAVAFGLFLSARWLVQKVRRQPTAKKPDTTQKAPEKVSSGTPPPSGATTPAPKPSTTTGSSNQTTQSNSGSQTSSAVTNLPSTGPAETLAVFMVATTAGTFAYQLSTRRK